ncbi:integral membrane protein 2B-like isoform X1 [Diadema antillarum]|uniref:integral membrane protein 2B-like isoform X1 n=1 Tax=Diadema antillarum TaxID=105358 RepID=UPI003A87D3B3
MTIYKTEGRIYTPKVVDDKKKTSAQTPTPLEECTECTNKCIEPECDCDCDCEAQRETPVVQVNRRRSRPCSTWALAAICTVTVGLCFFLTGLLYMATRAEFRSNPANFCTVMYPPEQDLPNATVEETIMVDKEAGIETFDVPKFENDHPFKVMSDFQIQITAFRDVQDERCYLVNHTDSLFEAPQTVLEFIQSYKSGDHMTNLQTITARMEIHGPAVDVSVMATSIRTHCLEISTFWLHVVEVVEEGTIAKRSISSDSNEKKAFKFFNSRKLVKVYLVE